MKGIKLKFGSKPSSPDTIKQTISHRNYAKSQLDHIKNHPSASTSTLQLIAQNSKVSRGSTVLTKKENKTINMLRIENK